MAKGIAMKFKSYGETVPKLLEILRLENELKKYEKIVIKPRLGEYPEENTKPELVEEVIKFCLRHKNPVAKVYIAEGADGFDTEELFDSLGFRQLAEKYSIGLVDLNTTEVEETESEDLLKFESIQYPKILKNSFIISIANLSEDEESVISGTLPNMLGAFPSEYYSGFFSSKKTKIRKWPVEYSIHDIVRCNEPQFAIIDASEKGSLLGGQPLEMDKQSAKLLGMNWQDIPYLKLLTEEKEES